VALVVSHPGVSFDDLGDSTKCPQLGRVALRPRSLEQGALDLAHLRRAQACSPTGAGTPLQRPRATLPPLLEPTADALAGDPKKATDIGLAEPLLEQLCRLPATSL
jgi:hypothetical protein